MRAGLVAAWLSAFTLAQLAVLLPVPRQVGVHEAKAAATTYYVDNTMGSDSNGCTARSKCQTVKRVISLGLHPGDTVCIDGNGTYTDLSEGVSPGAAGVINPTASGSASGGYIVFRNCDGGLPKIDATSAAANGICCAIGLGNGGNPPISYVQIGPGLELYGGADTTNFSTCNTNNLGVQPQICAMVAILLQGHHLRVTGNVIHDWGATGAGASGQAKNLVNDYIEYTNNIAYNNANWAYAGGSAFSVYEPVNLDNAPGYHIIIKNNLAFNNQVLIPNECYSSPGCATNYIDGNGCILDDGNHTQNGTWTVPEYSGRILVVGNVFAYNGGSGCHAFFTKNVDFIGNTVYKNEQTSNPHTACAAPCSTLGELGFYFADNGRAYGNIVFGKDGSSYYGLFNVSSTVSADYNARFSGAGTGSGLTGAHDITGDPLLARMGTYPGSTSIDAHPSVGSPVIGGFGGPVTLASISPDIYGSRRPQTGVGDIGAAEFCNPCLPSAAPVGPSGMLPRIAGKLPALVTTYRGVGDLTLSATPKMAYSIRALSSVARGESLGEFCTAGDAACGIVHSDLVTGWPNAAELAALGTGPWTLKTRRDLTGNGFDFVQTTEAHRLTLSTSGCASGAPYCLHGSEAAGTQYVGNFTTTAPPFSVSAVVSGTGGAAYEGDLIGWGSGGLFWRQGKASPHQDFQAYTNGFSSHCEGGPDAPANTYHAVHFAAPTGAGTARLSDNGTQVACSMTGGSMGTTYTSYNDGSGHPFTGNEDEVIIFSGLLSITDMTALDANQRGPAAFNF